MNDLLKNLENLIRFQNEIDGNLIFNLKENHKQILNENNEFHNDLIQNEVVDKVITKEIDLTKLNKEEYNENWKNLNSLIELETSIKKCIKCPLGDTRKNFVFGSGNPHADIMLIGEAPGADEDEQGLPFVGRAGQLLTKIIESINFKREEVFICNILKCRPPNNRKPNNSEVEECEPYLKKQIELIQPKFILLLGLTAAETILKKFLKMADIRGKLFEYEGIPTLVTYHPAALLRNPNWKPLVWEDVKFLRKLYDDYLIEKGKI